MNLFKRNEKLVDFPQSVEELDIFVSNLCKDYNLPENDDTYECIAGLIMHAPPSVSQAPLIFFASSVKKAIANKAAYLKLQGFDQARRAARKQDETEKSSNGQSVSN